MATLLGGPPQTMGGSGTLLTDDSTNGAKKKKSTLNLYGLDGEDQDGNGGAGKPQGIADTPGGTGVSTSGTEFAKSIAMAANAMTGPTAMATTALSLGLGITDMPGNYNTEPGYNQAYRDAYAAVQKDYPSMPGSFHSSIAAQRAADSVKGEKDKKSTEAAQTRSESNQAQGKGGRGGNSEGGKKGGGIDGGANEGRR